MITENRYKILKDALERGANLVPVDFKNIDEYEMKMKQKEYPIKTGREIINSILHIIIGGVIAYVILPTSTFIISICVVGVVAVIREVLQRLRGKKQPMYIHIIDIAGFMLGAAVWVYIRDKRKIKPDEL